MDHTLKNMRHAEACKAQKESLETRIASQAQISLLRKNGYTDGQLVEYNDKLNRIGKNFTISSSQCHKAKENLRFAHLHRECGPTVWI